MQYIESYIFNSFYKIQTPIGTNGMEYFQACIDINWNKLNSPHQLEQK